MGNLAAGPDPGQPLPNWVIIAQVLNVVLNLVTLAFSLVLTLGLVIRAMPRNLPGGRSRAAGVGR
jgi:hypothetical protein